MSHFQGAIGLVAFVTIAYLLSENRSSIRWKLVLGGLVIQFLLALLLLKFSFFQDVFLFLAMGVEAIEAATVEATRFMFGYLVGGGPYPYDLLHPEHGTIIAFRVLPLIMVISALSSLLYYWRVIPFIIHLGARPIRACFGASGPLAFAAVASIFFGVVETPLLIKPYLERLDRSELFAVLTCTMSTVAGTVMVLYSSVLSQVVDNPISHILVASLISVPAALTLAHIMIPGSRDDKSDSTIEIKSSHQGSMQALMTGAIEGMKMVVYIVAVIIVLFALIHLVNQILGSLPGCWQLQELVGQVFRPFLWLAGISWDDAQTLSSVMGTKIILNEFVAYYELAALGDAVSERGRIIIVYVLCGFANLGSVGIVSASLSAILPERQHEVAALALRAVLSGTLATLMTGAVVSLLL